MESLNQQIKSMNLKNIQSTTLENRILQLKQQLKLQEASNNIIKSKMNKIISTKKAKFFDQIEIQKLLQEQNTANINLIQNTIQVNKTKQQEEIQKLRQERFEEKYLKSTLLKQQLDLYDYQNKKQKEQELLQKQLQYNKISEWEFQLKQDLEAKKIEKKERIRQEQQEQKKQMEQRLNQQQTIYNQLSNEEQQLIEKLKNSQQHGNILKNNLITALNLSVKEYTNITGPISKSQKSLSQQQLPKDQINSPYAQLPTMLNLNIKGQFSTYLNSNTSFRESLMKEYQLSLPSLYKPSFNEQKQQVERLHQSKSNSTFKNELSSILNYSDKKNFTKLKKNNKSTILPSDISLQTSSNSKQQQIQKTENNYNNKSTVIESKDDSKQIIDPINNNQESDYQEK